MKLIVEASNICSRLDVFVSEQVEGLSRAAARRCCGEGFVLVNRRPKPGGYQLKEGDSIEIKEELEPVRARPALAAGAAPKRSLEILYEDKHLLAVQKPRAMHCVTLRANDPLTLADLISSHDECCLEASPDLREAGLIHRLDYYTCGVLLAAKSRDSWEKFRQVLQEHKIEKKYLALVEGELEKSKLKTRFFLSQSKDGKKMLATDTASDIGEQRETITLLELKETRRLKSTKPSAKFSQPLSLVSAKVNMAARHQIRVHLSELGCPLLGDSLYDAKYDLGLFRKGLEGFLLFAEEVSFCHPFSGEQVRIKGNSKEFDALVSRL